MQQFIVKVLILISFWNTSCPEQWMGCEWPMGVKNFQEQQCNDPEFSVPYSVSPLLQYLKWKFLVSFKEGT